MASCGRSRSSIYLGRRFKNDTECLEKLFELYTQMTAMAPAKKRARRQEGLHFFGFWPAMHSDILAGYDIHETPRPKPQTPNPKPQQQFTLQNRFVGI